MTTYGDEPQYDLTAENNNAATVSSGVVPGVNGYIFDLFEADVSLAVDPSYAAALGGGEGFAAVNAVAVFDLSAEMFNNLFFITVDSSDIDDTSANDIIFSIDGSNFEYPFLEKDGASDVSMAFSNSTVKFGAVNNQYFDQSLKKDIIRHVAKSITGGYAVADIFSNEQQLIDDVVDRDEDLHTKLHTAIGALQTGGSYTVDQIVDISDNDQKRFFSVARALFGINMNDVGGRQQAIYEDLSNNSVDSTTGEPLASVTVSLKFKVGDAIALRIQYDPNSSPVGGDTNGDGIGLGGMGNNSIPSRSYKILIPLS